MTISLSVLGIVCSVVCVSCWAAPCAQRPVSVSGLTDNVDVGSSLDVATLRQECSNKTIRLKIERNAEGKIVVVTEPNSLSPLARIAVDQFAAQVRMPSPSSAPLEICVDLSALSVAARASNGSVDTAPYAAIKLRQRVGVTWPLTTRSKFLGEAKVRVTVNASGSVENAAIVESTSPDYGLNALVAAYLCSFSMPTAFRNDQTASFTLLFKNTFSDDGRETTSTELEL